MTDSTNPYGLLAPEAPPAWTPPATGTPVASPWGALIGAPGDTVPEPPQRGVVTPTASPIVAPIGAAPPTSATSQPSLLGGSGTADFLVRHESGGKFDATNPTSGAYGLGQFTSSTAQTVAARHPELPPLTQFYSSDPAVAVPAQRAYIAAHVADQTKVLEAHGITPTPGNIHMNWFLGESGGPRFLKAMWQNPSQPGVALASPEQVAANKGVFYRADGTPRSASEVYAAINGGGQGGSTGEATAATPWQPPVAEAAATPADLIRGEMKLQLLRGMFPQHTLTPVAYDPWKAVPKDLGGKVDVNEGVK